MSGSALENWAIYAALIAFVPPVLSGLIVACSPRARTLMPGGASRLFWALWLQTSGLVIAFLALRLSIGAAIRSPLDDGVRGALLSALCAGVASVLANSVLKRVPGTAPLIADLTNARAPAAKPGKA